MNQLVDGGVLKDAAIVGLIILILTSLYVLKALWALMQTIAEQSTDPHFATPFLLTASLVVGVSGLVYILYVSQVTGTT